uniref:hypothetical protein n=1 Tax=Clostridium sp. NkU-1 TaxID=1095009 RepID=UPI0006D242BA
MARKKVILKELPVQWKLVAGFGVMLMLLLIFFGVSEWGISRVGNQVELYSKYTYPLTSYNVRTQREMAYVRNYLVRAILEKQQGTDYQPLLI